MYTLPPPERWQRVVRALRRTRWLPAFLLLPAALSGQEAPSSPPESELAEVLRNRLEAVRAAGDLAVAGRTLMAIRAVPAFYEDRGHRPAWTGRPGAEAGAAILVTALDRASDDGLLPGDYHARALDSLLASTGATPEDEVRRLVDLDLLLTDAFLVFGSHLLHGRVNPETVNPEWTANRRNADMAALLRRATESGRVAETLDALRPTQPRYARLRAALAHHRELARAGGWPAVPEGMKLEAGIRHPRVGILRKRLAASGDLPGPGQPGDPEAFDPALMEAVQRFQRRHGLDADGVVGPATLAALNVPVEARIRRLEVNLERWRWLPEDLGRRHLEVNIADFRVDVVEDGRPVLELRAVVGRAYRQTPGFTGAMTYLVFSPYWHVPPGIAANDKLPELKARGPTYLAEQRMTVLDRSDDRPVKPASVDWAAITSGEFNRRYRLRQDPGPWNALGGVKFMFPNEYNVYLHDTPSRELFGRVRRPFSSGCIRVERPAELAAYLLRGDPAWSPERIRAAMGRDREETVRLPEPVPVHVLYWTAWVDADGTVQLRDDVYGRDADVARALERHPEEI